MGLRRVGDVCQVIGKYKNKDGQEKNEYNRVGTLFQDSDGGRFSIKFSALPLVTMGKNGNVECWASVFSGDNNGGNRGGGSSGEQRPDPKYNDTPSDEDCPF